MENLEVKITEVEARSKSNTRRLDRLENIAEAIHEQSGSIRELVSEIKHTNDHIAQHDADLETQEKRLDVLEKVPAERWNSMKKIIVSTLISTICGGLAGAMLSELFL